MEEKLKKLRLLASTSSKRFLEELRDLIQNWKSLKKTDKKKFQRHIIEMQRIGQDLFQKLYYKKSDLNEEVIKAIEEGSQNVFDKSGLKSNVLKVREMLKYIQADEPKKALAVMNNLSSVAKTRGGTILNTLEIGNNRANVIENAKKRGITKFRYEGPTGILSRGFCKSRVGNVYTIEEIELMDNMQRLPVLYFCGGYNCRHRWVAVQGEKEGKLFIDDSWTRKLNNSNKQDRKKMVTEKQGAILMTELLDGSVVLRSERSSKGGDIDVFYNGEPAEIKTPEAFQINTLSYQLVKSKDQADIVIIILNNEIDEYEEAKNKAILWLRRHNKRLCIILNKKTNEKEFLKW